MAQAAGPLVPRRRLGAELRRLREAAGLQLADVAAELECSTSKVSRLETGKGIPKVRDVRDMLSLYGVGPGTRFDRLVTWAREGQQQGWWAEFSDLFQNDPTLPTNFDQYVALEADADHILLHESAVVPGLLQTEAYARAILRLFCADPIELERLVALRMRRQQLLDGPGLEQLDVVVSEAAVRRPVGGPVTWSEQLEHLLLVARNSRVSLRVLPLDAGEHPAITGPYTVLGFRDPETPDVVYIEFQLGTVFVDNLDGVRTYRTTHANIAAQSLDASASTRFIEDLSPRRRGV